MDLTELVGEIENKNNVFSNIIRSVEGEEGIYAIPTRFSLIGQTGTKEKIEVSTDIASWVESLEKDDDKPIIDSYQVESVVQNLLYVSYEEWIKDGSIDENKVDEFVTTVLKLCDCTGKKKLNLGSEISEPETTVNYYDVGCGTYEMVYDYIVSYGYQVQGIRAVADAINGDYKIPANGFEGTYIPSNLLGINSKSKNIEIANEFVNLLFSEEIQSISNGRGMPLNIDAFISDMYCEIKGEVEYKEGVMLNFVDFSDAETRDTINMIKKLNKPIIRDGIMLDIVYETLAQCIEGKISKDEAVRNISEKVMLYISEQ